MSASQTNLLLRAYYEALYEKLVSARDVLDRQLDALLAAEIKKRGFGISGEARFNAYKDACKAFIEERIELYDPVGVQYTFDGLERRQAFELQMQLDWYEARAEYEQLVQAAEEMVQPEMTDQLLCQLAARLVARCGAYPDKSIIRSYEASPSPNRLPDYIVARAIEQTIR